MSWWDWENSNKLFYRVKVILRLCPSGMGGNKIPFTVPWSVELPTPCFASSSSRAFELDVFQPWSSTDPQKSSDKNLDNSPSHFLCRNKVSDGYIRINIAQITVWLRMLLVYFILISALLPINCFDSMLRYRVSVSTRICFSIWPKFPTSKQISYPANLSQRYSGFRLYSSSTQVTQGSIGNQLSEVDSALVVEKPKKAAKKVVKVKLPKISEITEDAAR